MVEILSAHSPKMLILASRTPSKIQEIIDSWQANSPNTTYISVALDLGSQKSVREAASAILADSRIEKIDQVYNNAAVMRIPERQLSPEGIEMHFATNHIGHFLFTNLIMPKILAAAKSNPKGATRIVNVSSRGVMYSPVRFSDLNFDKPFETLPHAEQPAYEAVIHTSGPLNPKDSYHPMVGYGQSKSANVLFSLELTKRLYGKYGILSYGLHPGAIMTELARHIDKDEWEELAEKFKSMFVSIDQGCATSLRAGLDDSLGPADFKGDGKGIYLSDAQITEGPEWVHDPKLAAQLWEVSEKLVGEEFEF
jgi:NAD(P)-dependent dehydrogenase (short-subunit alcohol dehydrogenase family)